MFMDPSGHTACQGKNWDDGPQCFGKTPEEKLKKLGVTVDPKMPPRFRNAIIAAAIETGGAFAEHSGGSAESAFKNIYTAVHFQMGCGDDCRSKYQTGSKKGQAYGNEGGAFSSGWQNTSGYFLIKIGTMEDNGGMRGMIQMVHELGHNYLP